MKLKIFNKFKDVEKGHLWNDFKRYSAVCIYDTLDEDAFDYVISNIDKIKQKALEITFDINNTKILDKAKKLNFVPDYHWYIYNISENDKNLDLDNNVVIVKKRKIVKELLVAQMHELAQREPNMFDKNGEVKDWYKSGKECIAYIEDKEIISVLTWQYEPQNNNIHIYLTYTQPECRSKGYNSKLFDYIKKYAFEHNIKTITVCTDITEENRVPNMFFKNGFKYFKTGFEKIIVKDEQDISEYLKRVENVSLDQLLSSIEKLYDLQIIRYEIITQGYEDLNVRLKTDKGSFLTKIFNKERSVTECSDIVERFTSAYNNGISCPKIFINKNSETLSKFGQTKYFLMEFISGKDFQRMNRTLNQSEMLLVLEELKKFEKLNLRFEKTYNAWEMNNFALEYEKNFELFGKEEIALFKPIYDRFKQIDLTKLPYAYIHGDVNSGNTMKNAENKIVLLDLCSANYSNRINEILTICSSGLIIDCDKEKTIENICHAFNLWCSAFNATKIEKDNFYFLYQVQTALNYMQALCEFKKGNRSAENVGNLKEDYDAFNLATEILNQTTREKTQ